MSVTCLVNTFHFAMLIEYIKYRHVSIAQLVGQCIIICRDRGSNLGHPTYSSYKVNFSHYATDKKIISNIKSP